MAIWPGHARPHSVHRSFCLAHGQGLAAGSGTQTKTPLKERRFLQLVPARGVEPPTFALRMRRTLQVLAFALLPT